MFRIGEIEIYLICDSLTKADGGGMFGLVPRKLWSRYKAYDDENMIFSNTLCLLVKAEGKTILVDTGMSENKLDDKSIRRWQLTRPHGSLADALTRLNIRPDEIDIVLNTHLHSDHCLGNTIFTPQGEILPTFPNATYYVQRREYEDAMNPNERTAGTYFAFNYEPLLQNGQMVLLDEPEVEIVRGVKMVVTRGHTPAHCSVVFESGGEAAMFLCDLASMAVHFEKLAWMTAYDVEPLMTLESKRRWQKWAVEQNALLFVVHDADMPVARLVQDEKGNLTMQAVEYAYS